MKSKILSLTMLVLIVTLALVACGDSDEHTHTWEAATCITAKTCSECGIETGSVSTTNHNYGEWQTVKTVSCTENGIKKQTCSWCNNEKTETITATGHNYVDTICTNCNKRDELSLRDIRYFDKDDYYEWWVAIENSSGELVKADATITYYLYNANDIVYTNTFVLSPNDFTEMTRSNGDIELRGLFVVQKSDIKPGVNNHGKSIFHADIYGNKFIQDNLSFDSIIPQLQTTLNTPTLPKTIYNKSSSGTTNQMLKVTDITYEISGTTMYIYFSGEKTFDREGDNYSRIFKIGFKLYDSNGNVVDSGTIYVTALSVGDKFANTKESVYGITLGENYTLELIDVT